MKTKYLRARKIVEQLRKGEWDFIWNPLSSECLTAKRNGLTLWTGNGPFWCALSDPKFDAFGLIFRHYVYWYGVYPQKLAAEKVYKAKRITDQDIDSQLNSEFKND